MAVYSIKEIEKLCKKGANYGPASYTNIRYYTDDDLKKILNVAVLNRQGIKISNIARLNDLELKEEIIRVSSTSYSHSTIVDSMVIALIDMDEYKLEALIDKSISKVGISSTVIDVLYPLLDKVGILWQSGDIYPAQEHFATNLIRQKIISATDQLPNTFNPKGKKFLLLLPEGEWHEIALLFTQYLIKEANHEVLYLCQSVPYRDVRATGASKHFDFIVVSSTTTQAEFDLFLYLRDLGGAFPDKKILCFSSFMGEKPSGLSQNHLRLHYIEDLTNFLADLS